MKKTIGIFSFLFFILCLASFSRVESAVSGLGSIASPQVQNFNTNWYLSANDFYSGYNTVNVTVSCVAGSFDVCVSETYGVSFNGVNRSNSFNQGYWNITLLSYSNNVKLKFTSFSTQHELFVNVTARNITDGSWYSNWFYVLNTYNSAPYKTATMSNSFSISTNESLIIYPRDFFANMSEFVFYYYYGNGQIQQFDSADILGMGSDCQSEDPWFTACVHKPDSDITHAYINITAGSVSNNRQFVVYPTSYLWGAGTSNVFTVLMTSDDTTVSDSAVYQTASINDIDLGYDDIVEIPISYFFNNFDGAQLYYNDANLSLTSMIELQVGQGMMCSISGIIKACLIPSANDIKMKFYGLKQSGITNVTLIVSNDVSTANDTFRIYTTASSGVVGSDELKQGESFFSYLTGMFLNLFPDSNTLSGSYKFAFVFVSLISVSVVLLVVFYNTSGITPASLYIILILDLLLTLYFVSISYIPVTYIAVLALGAVGLFYLKKVGVG